MHEAQPKSAQAFQDALAALLGALPLIFGFGIGAGLRQPFGI
ncbi:MAG TPA: hypothetical protein VM571_14565 [Noviherbaspirillum sp.]|nr:hypothetical protein [Noviherbaspirillum sp.]